MALTYEPIATTTVGTATPSITFSSIPQTYTDLRIVFSGKSTTGLSSLILRLNNDTSTANYYGYNMYSQSTTPTGSFESSLGYINVGAMAVSLNSSVIDIFKYTITTYRALLIRGSNSYTSLNERRASAKWLGTTAITTVTLTSSSNNLEVGSMATLYGIKAA